MSITLTFTTSDGKKEQVEYKKDVKIIVLNNKRIADIDLTSLSSCTSLE